MRGFELQRARKVLRDELRRDARNALPAGQALDAEDLLHLAADAAATNRGNVLRRILVQRALASMGYTDAELAAAFNLPAAQIAAERTASLFGASTVVGDIEERVLRERPETAEPERIVRPTGDFARPADQLDEDRLSAALDGKRVRSAGA